MMKICGLVADSEPDIEEDLKNDVLIDPKWISIPIFHIVRPEEINRDVVCGFPSRSILVWRCLSSIA